MVMALVVELLPAWWPPCPALSHVQLHFSTKF